MSMLSRDPWTVAKEIPTPAMEIGYLVDSLLDAMGDRPESRQGKEFAVHWTRYAWGVDLLVALALRCPEHRELRHYGTLINHLEEISNGDWPGDSEGTDLERVLLYPETGYRSGSWQG